MKPMNLKHGVGFTSDDPLPEDLAKGYRYEQVGRYHNYHVTTKRWDWPLKYEANEQRVVIDAFSPNLNKELHVGHLRNLAIASSLQRLMADQPNTNFVALLGTTLGVKKASLIEWGKWLQWTGYSPTIFYDCALPQDNVKCHQQYPPTIKTHELHDEIAKDHPWVWDGPEGDVIVKRADGTRLYAFHDLSFADWVDPTHYITGQEQREHFKSLGFEDKHLPMGLVLGDDGKKLKSREGTAMPINDALGLAAERLEDTPEPGKLAWNVLVWNILSAKRENDLKFQVENWTNPSLPGMYVSYTYSRVHAALSRSMTTCCKGKLFAFNRDDELVEQEFMDVDLRLLGVAEQYHWHRQQSIERFDPCLLAAYSMTLATVLSGAYQKEQIKGGRPAFVAAIGHALYRLHACMEDLGLFPLETV